MNLRRLLNKKILSGLAAAIGIAGTATFGPWTYVKLQDNLNKPAIERKLTNLESSLTNDYGIPINVWKMEFGEPRIPKQQNSLKDFSKYTSLCALEGLEEFLQCYPPDILKSRFTSIQLVKEFISTYDGSVSSNDLANISLGRTITISAGRNSPWIYHKALFGRLVDKFDLHHEMGHELAADIPKDEWIALNQGKEYSGYLWRSLKTVPAGFYNEYATNKLSEDIASTVELLYCDKKIYGCRTSSDPILKSKAEFLKRWYYKVSSGRFDQNYWDAVQSSKRPVFQKNK